MVGDHVGADRQDLALLRGRDLAAHHVVAGEAGAHEVLEAVLHPLHGLADHQRGHDRADVAGVDRHLVAEAAADVRRDHPDLVLGQPGDQRVDGPVRVRGLAGGPQRELPADPLVVGDAAAGLHRSRVDARVDDVLGDDHVGAGEDRLGRRLVAGLPVEAVVVGLPLEVVADHRGVRREGGAYVDHRRQGVVLHVDQLERVARRVAVLGHHERDLLALEPDLVGGEHGLHVVGQGGHPGQPLSGQVGAGDDRLHLGVGQRGGRVDADDPGMGDGRAQDREVQHPGQLDVVDVAAHPADEARVLLAEHPAVPDRRLVVVDPLEVLAGFGRGHDVLPTVSVSACGVGLGVGLGVRGPVAARVRGGPLHRAHDRGVAGAAADLSGDGLADRLLAGVRVAVEQRPRRHQHARGAEAALQPVAAHEALLDGVEHAVHLEVLDRAHLVAAGHRGQHGAGLDRLPVQPGHAGAAVAGVATPVRPGQPELVAQEVDQQQPPLDLPGDALPVHGHRHLHVSRPFPGRLDVVAGPVSRHPGADPLHRAPQRAPGQLVGEVALVVGRPPGVGHRGAALRRDRSRPGVELLRRLPAAQRLGDGGDAGGVRPDRGQADPRVGDHRAVHPHRGAGRGDRPVAGPAFDLGVGARAVRPQRDPDLGQDLAVLHRRLVGAAEEVAHRDHPLPARAADHAAGVDGGADRGQVLGGVGLAEGAADRAAVADDGVGDDPLRVGEDREVRGELGRLQQLPVPGHRPDPDLVGPDPDVAELVVEVVDVDDVLEVGQPQLHHRQQAVSARDQPGLVTQPLQESDRLVDARGPRVLEGRRNLHG